MSDSTFHSHSFDNGLTLVAESLPHSRAAAFQFLLPAGAVTDPDDRPGAATVLENLSYRGAGARNSRELSDALDNLGLQRGGGADLEYATFSGSLLAEDLTEALTLYADILLRPRLPEDEVEAARTVALQRLEALEDQPAQKLFVHLQEAFFPGPYGRTAMGTPEGIRALSHEEVRADHARRYRPQDAILAVAGKFEWATLVETVGRLFGEWTGAAPAPPERIAGHPSAYLHLPKETAQEQIGVAYPEVDTTSDDYYNALMAINVLSSGMGARLFTEVREKRGLVYSVFASYRAIKGCGMVMAYAGTTPERSQETLDVLLGELKRLAEGVTEEEVARARTGLLSSLVMQGESTGARGGALTRDQYLRGRVRSLDEIRAEVERVTPESITAHLRAHPPGNFTVVTLGPTELEVRA